MVIVSLIFGLLGLLMVTSVPVTLRKHFRVKTWSQTEGTILTSLVQKNETSDSDGNHSVSYAPMVTYSYRANNKEFCGNKIAFQGDWEGLKFAAQRKVDSFPVGRNCHSVLQPNESGGMCARE